MEKKTVAKEPTTPEAVQQNIDTILELEKEAIGNLSSVEHIAVKITSFAGSTPFIIFHIIWFTGWILTNCGAIPGITPFDPYPFSFLTMVVSLEAIFLTLLVLMSQNRMTKEADKRAHLDLQINLLDEQETTMILRMVQKITKHMGLDEVTDTSINDLIAETDITTVAKIINEKVNK